MNGLGAIPNMGDLVFFFSFPRAVQTPVLWLADRQMYVTLS